MSSATVTIPTPRTPAPPASPAPAPVETSCEHPATEDTTYLCSADPWDKPHCEDCHPGHCRDCISDAATTADCEYED